MQKQILYPKRKFASYLCTPFNFKCSLSDIKSEIFSNAQK
jgi:hypothetical protein